MMTRHEQMTKGGSLDSYSNFIGDDSSIRDFLCGPGRHRDSDCLAESNFATALKMLGGESPTVQIHRFGHWAVGWIEQIYVDPKDADRVKILEEIESSLENYPVLDYDDFSQREQETVNQLWADCYTTKQRIEYIRKRRREFEFHDYADLINNVRGKYFSGECQSIL